MEGGRKEVVAWMGIVWRDCDEGVPLAVPTEATMERFSEVARAREPVEARRRRWLGRVRGARRAAMGADVYKKDGSARVAHEKQPGLRLTG